MLGKKTKKPPTAYQEGHGYKLRVIPKSLFYEFEQVVRQAAAAEGQNISINTAICREWSLLGCHRARLGSINFMFRLSAFMYDLLLSGQSAATIASNADLSRVFGVRSSP